MEKASDQLWDSLYWTHDLTRPDRLAKAINTIVRKNSTDVNQFLYDNQAAKNIHKLGLTQHDIDRFAQLDKLLSRHAHSSSSSGSGTGYSAGSAGLNVLGLFSIDGGGGRSSQSQSQQSTNIENISDSMHDRKTDKNHLNVTNSESNNDTQYTLSRDEVEKYLSELSDHVHLEGEIILPKPIDAHLIKLSTLRAETKLLSHTVVVRTRSNVHILPLRCPPEENRKTVANTTSRYRWLEDKVEQLTATVERFANRLSEIKEQTSARVAAVEQTCTDRVIQVEQNCTNRVAEVEKQWTSKTNEFKNRLTAVQRNASDEQKQLDSRIQALAHLQSRITEINRTSEECKQLESRIVTLERKANDTIMGCE